ncbi:glycoside hydrolase family 5 protein [Vararia minispora EC-137]|uniref:Glycoside hydrolase family 5 protein n=1 Tax=Vararia minispora EC-137 TaxID=1314806 RepID=A0ACB8QDA6_9AGAM|nr:glycoside hydrolase family 5 protein [Vararia minispora EC-137]
MGGNGSVVTTANGTAFVYNNPFGGFWVADPADPFSGAARPNAWTPPLNVSWDFGADRIYGVNLGGLFVLEPFITPALFQKYPNAVDEWTLSEAMRADEAGGGIGQIEEHYKTFITEPDIAEIAGAGLNWIRVPIGFWAIETWEGEPFLESTSWQYFLRILGWARKYGLRVLLDLHALPGSQNGVSLSYSLSPVNFMNGNMGLANAQRALYYIRVLTEFVSQPAYRDLIPIFGIVNEALVGVIGMEQISSFYLQAHDMIRGITGFGAGNGPYIAIHDGFQGLTVWQGFLAGSDRIMLDQHPYLGFGAVQTDPIAAPAPNGLAGGVWPKRACDSWAPSTNARRARSAFGVTITGEFTGTFNDCGLFVSGVGANSTNPQCPEYDDWRNFNATMKEGLANFVRASYDAFGDWFFWTWKIGAAASGEIEAPLWSYQLGLRNGWIPSDPRTFVGTCAALGTAEQPWNGTFAGWQTGAPTSSVAPSSRTSLAFPPSLSNIVVPMTLLPTYTPTGTITTLSVPTTFTRAPKSVTAGVDGWFDKQDTAGGVTTVAGCGYPDEYNGIFSTTPTAPCTGPTAAAGATTVPGPAATAATTAGAV